MRTASLRTLGLWALALAAVPFSCRSVPDVGDLELGLRPSEVHQRIGKPAIAYLRNRPENGYVRKMLIEEYLSPPGHRLHLTYTIPIDMDEIAILGETEWARSIAPALAKGATIASLDAVAEKKINMRCGRLLRYRRLAVQKPQGR